MHIVQGHVVKERYIGGLFDELFDARPFLFPKVSQGGSCLAQKPTVSVHHLIERDEDHPA